MDLICILFMKKKQYKSYFVKIFIFKKKLKTETETETETEVGDRVRKRKSHTIKTLGHFQIINLNSLLWMYAEFLNESSSALIEFNLVAPKNAIKHE